MYTQVRGVKPRFPFTNQIQLKSNPRKCPRAQGIRPNTETRVQPNTGTWLHSNPQTLLERNAGGWMRPNMRTWPRFLRILSRPQRHSVPRQTPNPGLKGSPQGPRISKAACCAARDTHPVLFEELRERHIVFVGVVLQEGIQRHPAGVDHLVAHCSTAHTMGAAGGLHTGPSRTVADTRTHAHTRQRRSWHDETAKYAHTRLVGPAEAPCPLTRPPIACARTSPYPPTMGYIAILLC